MCKTIVKQKYFTCHKKNYVQREGLALGVPTSAILSQIYLRQLEQKQIINLLTKPKMVGYFWDVDDIIIVFHNNAVTELHKEFNREENKLCLKLWNAIENQLHRNYHNYREWRSTIISIQETDCHQKYNIQQHTSPSATYTTSWTDCFAH
jgi:hypothetical protein